MLPELMGFLLKFRLLWRVQFGGADSQTEHVQSEIVLEVVVIMPARVYGTSLFPLLAQTTAKNNHSSV